MAEFWNPQAEYAAHYNTQRPHRALQLRPPRPQSPVPEPVSAGFSEMDEARQGVRVQFGETVTDTSGIGLTVTDPRAYYVDEEAVVGPDEQAYQIVVTVVNRTQNPIASSLIRVHAMVDTTPADSIDLGRLTAQDIAPGQQLTIPFRFKVQDGPSGPLQIAVEYVDNDPVIFTGSL